MWSQKSELKEAESRVLFTRTSGKYGEETVREKLTDGSSITVKGKRYWFAVSQSGNDGYPLSTVNFQKLKERILAVFTVKI
jgi:hypothetical protein